MTTQTEKPAKILKDCLEILQSSITVVQEYHNDDENERAMSSEIFRQLGKEYSEIEEERDRTKDAIEKVKKYFNDDANDCTVSVREIYNNNLKAAKTNYKEQEIWKSIIKLIDANADEEPELENSVLDQTLVCSGSFAVRTDPISKKKIEKPCKNIICNHVYDYVTILAYIKQKKKGQIKCPYMGCGNNNLRQIDIVQDDNLLSNDEDDKDNDQIKIKKNCSIVNISM